MSHDDSEGRNIADSILEKMPQPMALPTIGRVALGGSVNHVAVPSNYQLQVIDDEKLLANPRRAKTTATLVDPDSFLAYVKAHDDGHTDVWCNFDPVAGVLVFKAVFDEHRKGAPGWREKVAVYTPATSVEWKTWLAHKGPAKKFAQVEFAEFIEANEKDIAGGDGTGFPSSIEMMRMATQFEANAEKTFKSKIQIQGGGVELSFVDQDNAETVERMKVFSRFQLGLPIFWTMPKPDQAVAAWPLAARLKYHVASAKVTFWYELIRPDVVYELAALQLIGLIRGELGDIPLRMGSCS